MEEKIVRISEILTKNQIDELIELVKKKKGIEPTSLEFTKELKELFRKHEKYLLERGILPDYIAYAIAFQLSKIPEVSRIDILKIEKEKAKKLEEVL
jgi:hypothetical protein